jgi:hypothetical protein
MKKRKNPRPLSLVKFDFTTGSKDVYPFSEDDRFIFIGEIPNMPGHCILQEYKQRPFEVLIGYHTGNFIELTEEEV